MTRIPTYGSHLDAKPGGDYRLENDEDYIVHVWDRWPEGLKLQVIDDNCSVDGVRAGGHEAAVTAFALGRHRVLHLVAEGQSGDAESAFAVWGRWRGLAPWEKNAKLGHLPKDIARDLSTRFDGREYCTALRCVFLPRPGGVSGVRFQLAVVEP